MSLKEVYNILEDIAKHSKKTDKANIIKTNLKNELLKKVVFYACDPYKRFKTTGISYISSIPSQIAPQQNNNGIFKILDLLATQSGCSKSDELLLSQVSSIDIETVEVINRIVRKDLRCGVSEKSWKGHFADLPYHEVQTCTDNIERYKRKCGKSDSYWSLKLDGVRLWAICSESDSIEYRSRNGLLYPNFGVFDKEVLDVVNKLRKNYKLAGTITLDGEATSTDKTFNTMMSNVRKLKTINPEIFRFGVFDIAVGGIKFSKRYEMIEKSIGKTYKKLTYIKHEKIDKDQDMFEFMLNIVEKTGEEGIVVKAADSMYTFKEHSSEWLKLKPVETYDLPVVGFYMGDENKKHASRIGGLIVNFKGKEVRVGSGYSDEERDDFLLEQPKLIEVKAKGETPDGSLREPRFIRVRDDKDTVSEN